MTYINIYGYKFINLNNLQGLQHNLKTHCLNLGLKGTILLGNEGINAFLSGNRTAIDRFYECLLICGLPKIEFKESFSDAPPFDRMIVKIKPEIVTMGVPELNVAKQPAPTVSATTFKQWIDENKDVIILDTRNTYEVGIGKFKNAIHLGIENFRAFPQAINTLPPEYKDKTIVTYCTGGIRCEKAAPYLLSQGFKDVYQLEGGILKYLEECGETHYEGECFVFDKRIAVDAQLAETATTQCIACRHPVTHEEQQSPLFIAGISCPHCHDGSVAEP